MRKKADEVFREGRRIPHERRWIPYSPSELAQGIANLFRPRRTEAREPEPLDKFGLPLSWRHDEFAERTLQYSSVHWGLFEMWCDQNGRTAFPAVLVAPHFEQPPVNARVLERPLGELVVPPAQGKTELVKGLGFTCFGAAGPKEVGNPLSQFGGRVRDPAAFVRYASPLSENFVGLLPHRLFSICLLYTSPSPR